MILDVKSRSEAERVNDLTVPHLIVSIRDPDAPPANPKQTALTKAVLFRAFDDLDKQPGASTIAYLGREAQLFAASDAEAICQAVLDTRPEGVIAHCEAGISRSAGVAAALAAFFNGDDSDYFATRGYSAGRYAPNMLVYGTLLYTLVSWRPKFVRVGMQPQLTETLVVERYAKLR